MPGFGTSTATTPCRTPGGTSGRAKLVEHASFVIYAVSTRVTKKCEIAGMPCQLTKIAMTTGLVVHERSDGNQKG